MKIVAWGVVVWLLAGCATPASPDQVATDSTNQRTCAAQTSETAKAKGQRCLTAAEINEQHEEARQVIRTMDQTRTMTRGPLRN